MDLTEGSHREKVARAKKNMLWFGLISLTMSFAGLTSAYVVSSERPDWIIDFNIPSAFYISLALIVASSITLFFAVRLAKKNEHKFVGILLITTFLLGAAFVYFQFQGFSQIIGDGYYFTGEESNITTSFIYLVVLLHVAHVSVGLICLLVTIYNEFKQKYNNGNTLGLELAATFWHFVDFLWIYLFFFIYFM